MTCLFAVRDWLNSDNKPRHYIKSPPENISRKNPSNNVPSLYLFCGYFVFYTITIFQGLITHLMIVAFDFCFTSLCLDNLLQRTPHWTLFFYNSVEIRTSTSYWHNDGARNEYVCQKQECTCPNVHSDFIKSKLITCSARVCFVSQAELSRCTCRPNLL